MKKLLTLMLAAAILLPCILSGCNLLGKTPDETTAATTPNTTTPAETTPEVTTPEETTPEATTPEETTPEETTPEETTPEIPPEEIIDPITLTSVNITTGENVSEIYAGTELLFYLQKKGIENATDVLQINISIDNSIGMDGFKIEANLKDEYSMTIKGGNERGVLYGVYRFLEIYGGFRFFTPTLETQTEDAIVIPHGTLMDYVPPMSTRRLTWYLDGRSADWCVKNGINGCDTALNEIHGGAHLNYGSYFVHTIGSLSGTTYPYPVYGNNPCLTDPEVYNTVLANVRKALAANPAMNIISISQSDYEGYCHCPNCARIDEEEGSPSGNWIRFLNKIAEELEDEYPDVIIDTLAYKYTQAPPKITKPHKNICVRLCSITCCFTHSLDDPDCPKGKKFHDDLVGWGKICDNIHVWDYTTNFHYYISTFANLFTIRDNMRFFAENNVVSMFPQGNSQGESGEFGELRCYLLAQLMWNPYMSDEEYDTHMNEFLAAYYGEGWENIRAFIDKTSELAANGGYKLDGNENPTNAVCGQGIYDHPLTVITRQEYLDNEAYFNELWANAKALAGDRLAYVERSEMQWRLTKLYLHPNAEDAQKLIDDAKAAGVVWKEGNPNVQADSDLSLSPYYWKYGK
jgi:hypothetical protein